MPQFSKASCERIGRVVKTVETRFDDITRDVTPPAAQDDLSWFVLTTDLDKTTHEASANPCEWNIISNSGKGAYFPNTAITRTVRDTIEKLTLSSGAWVLCRPIGNTKGTVWEIVNCGGGGNVEAPPFGWAITNENALNGNTCHAFLLDEDFAATETEIILTNRTGSNVGAGIVVIFVNMGSEVQIVGMWCVTEEV